MKNLTWQSIIIGALSACLIGLLIYSFIKFSDYQKQIEFEKAKAKKWSDSLFVHKTELGEIVKKHAVEISLKNDIISQLTQSLKIALEFHSVVPVIPTKDTLFAFHSPEYQDSGCTILISDSVWFIKENDKWYSVQNINFETFLELQQTIGRDSTGNFYGQVETRSKKVLITSLNTIINDKYNPSNSGQTPGIFTTKPKILGICGDIDSRSVAGGISVNLGDYGISLKYIGFSKDFPDNLPFLEKLRLGVTYFIF